MPPKHAPNRDWKPSSRVGGVRNPPLQPHLTSSLCHLLAPIWWPEATTIIHTRRPPPPSNDSTSVLSIPNHHKRCGKRNPPQSQPDMRLHTVEWAATRQTAAIFTTHHQPHDKRVAVDMASNFQGHFLFQTSSFCLPTLSLKLFVNLWLSFLLFFRP